MAVLVAVQVDTLGMEYYVMTYMWSPLIGIVAIEDSTDVTVTLPDAKCGKLSVRYNGTRYTNNGTINFTLNRQVVSPALFSPWCCYRCVGGTNRNVYSKQVQSL